MPVIDRNTGISIGVMVLVVGAIVTCTIFLQGIKAEVATASIRIDNIVAATEDAKDDRYRMTNASEDALREAIENPGHRVPDPRNPGSVFVVEQGNVVRP